MTRRDVFGGGVLLFAIGVGAVTTLTPAQAQPAEKSAIQKDRVVAGGSKDFMEVRHVVLKGTNEEIGRALAILAKEGHKFEPVPSADRISEGLSIPSWRHIRFRASRCQSNIFAAMESVATKAGGQGLASHRLISGKQDHSSMAGT